MSDPWGHQPKARKAIEDAYRAGKRSIACVIPTGGGKTHLFSQVARGGVTKGFRWGVFVHRDELIKQTVEAFSRLGMNAGVIAAGYPRSESLLQVVSTQTAIARGDLPDFDSVVFDECHHFCGAEKWSGIPAHYRERKALVLGFTATPERGDGVALGNSFDELIVVCQPQQLIDAGVLVPARIIHPMRQSKALAMHPLEFHARHGKGRRFIIFAASVKHAKDLAHEFTAAGYPCACVEGSMRAEDREAAITAFRRGELAGLTNYMVLTEGFNVTEVSEIVTCREFSSPGPMMQALGRGLRAAPGKVDLIAGDLRGWSLDPNIGLPADDREFSLDGRAIKVKAGSDPVRQCQSCFAMFRSAEFEDGICPQCGWVTRGRPNPAIRRQAMSERAQGETGEDRVKYLSRCVNACLIDGHELGKARFLHVVKYTPPAMLQRKVRAAYKWPNKATLEASGHDAAKDVLREIAMYNMVHGKALAPVINGFPGKGAQRPWVDTKELVAVIRRALVEGSAEGVCSGRLVRVEMVDAKAMKETGT
ncbi:MAG: DEAD/DEAH box helicase [Parcubacteria group bacterium]